MNEFPDELEQYTMNTKDVTSNGNYGYETITTLLCQGEES